jgi:decaprenyl-phosphate phosphoribosyltransferase
VSLASAILITLRPRQWVKNLFVLAPLVFSKHLFDLAFALKAGVAAVAFCCLSGAVYAFNDVRDVAQDRQHPVKCRRPVAAGQLGESTALAVGAVLGLFALVVCGLVSVHLLAAASAYGALNLAYTLHLKRIAFVDVLVIASGFLLRVVAGALAIGVPVSPWLLACTALLASLLGFGKRAHELTQTSAADAPHATRASLAGYSAGALRWAMYALAAATSGAYALYTQDLRTVEFFGTRQLVWTLPFCAIGIARFLMLALWTPHDDSPTDAILRDPVFLVNILLWGGTVLFIIYR